LFGSIAGFITGVSVGYLWSSLGRYGLLISLAGAYFLGFCIYYAMTKVIGYKIGRRIQVIAAIGGFKFMQEFHDFLCQYRKYENLNLARAFDWYADGIGGWCR
jgi:hypothetical protein